MIFCCCTLFVFDPKICIASGAAIPNTLPSGDLATVVLVAKSCCAIQKMTRMYILELCWLACLAVTALTYLL